jgi:monoamine oxidase
VLSFTVEPDGQPPVNWQRPVGRDLQLLGHLGGTPARDLGRAGPQAMADFGLEQLTLAFGTDFRDEVQAIVSTGWQANPFVRGAYSEARPGHAADRRAAIAARTGRVAFAGEALSPDAQTTCHGAWASGQVVARRLLAEELRA